MKATWIKRVLLVAALAAFAPNCGDSDGDDAAKVTESPNIGDKAAETVTAEKGGTVALDDAGVSLSVPAGAVSGDEEITAEVISKKSLPDAASIAGNVIEFLPSGLQFSKPVTLEIDLAGATIPDKATVAIAWLDEKKGEWIDLPGSKLVGGKAVGETTHFTKFAIHFVVDDEGNIMQTSGQCDVSKFKACGGSVEGTWEYTAACVTVGPKTTGDGSDPLSKCVTADLSVDFSGTVTFADGNMTGNQVMEVSGSTQIDKACLMEVQMSMAMGQTVPEVMCSAFNDEDDEGNPVVAEDTGDACKISNGGKKESSDIDGTYSVKGTTLTTADNAQDGGAPGEPDSQEYCVDGDTLSVLGMDEDGTTFLIQATRKR